MDFQKIEETIEKELNTIFEKGLSANTLQNAKSLIEMKKDLAELKGTEGGEKEKMPRYSEYRDYRPQYRGDGGEWEARGYYKDDYIRERERERNFGSYRGYDPRMRDHMDRIMEGAEVYEYGRDRYMHGGDEARLEDGLEKMMYAVCMFIESTMEFAETPREKEIIRNHIQKLSKL